MTSERAFKWVFWLTLTGCLLAVATADAGTAGPAYPIQRFLVGLFSN